MANTRTAGGQEQNDLYPDLSIIIVNWNSINYVERCVAAIYQNADGFEFEIIVIDNASFDGCGRMLKQVYPQVRFIQSRRNLGFAKANNEAVKVARGRNILFLNPDTEVQADSIGTLLQHLESIPNAGVMGARLLNTDGSVQTTCITAFPTLLNQLLDTEMLRQRFPRSNLWGMRPLHDPSLTPTKVDAVSGACLIIKRSVHDAVGAFSTDYFMYSEDIDLCYKAKERGFGVYFVPEAIVIHHGGASSSQANADVFFSIMMMQSRWRFFRKTRSSLYGAAFRAMMFSVSIFRTCLLLSIRSVHGVCRKDSWSKAALKKWVAILRWSLGGEGWARDGHRKEAIIGTAKASGLNRTLSR